MKFQQIIFALNRIIQVLISLEFTLLNIIPKSLVTLQFLKFLIVQIKAYIQGFQMRYQSFLGHWYPNSYSWFSHYMDILFVLITPVQYCFNDVNFLLNCKYPSKELNVLCRKFPLATSSCVTRIPTSIRPFQIRYELS